MTATAQLPLPTAPEAERTVLGGVLRDNEVYPEVAIVAIEDFALDSHRRIWTRILELGEAGKPIDILTVQQALSEHKELEKVGGVGYLAGLTEGLILRKSLAHQAREIVEKSRLRKIYHACRATGTAILEQTGEGSEWHISGLQESLLQIQMASQRTTAVRIGDIAGEVLTELKQQAKERGLIGMPTGIPELDKATTGIRPGELWVVGALPARGKTALGLQMAEANALAGIPAAVFSLEMSKGQTFRRLLAAESGIAATYIRDPRPLGQFQWEDLEHTAERMKDLPLFVDDSPTLHIRELVARARLYKRRHGLELIVVDYLRLVDAEGEQVRHQAANVAAALRALAKAENIGVVLLSQLRRPQHENERPTMISLKESGDIEAHAHVVLLLYQPIEIKEGQTRFLHDLDEIIVGKQREGPMTSIPVQFDPTASCELVAT